MKGQQVGYIRVSSVLQNTDRQLDDVELDQAFEDRLSAKDAKRPKLTACIKHLRKGDTLHVHSIDRLARNLSDLESIVQQLTDKGVTVRFHKENMEFSGGDNPIQTMMLQIMGSFAQFERSLINERRREGMAMAKAKGKHMGRPRSITDDTIKEVIAAVKAGKPKSKVAQRYGISRQKVYDIMA